MPKRPEINDKGMVDGADVPHVELISSEHKDIGWNNFMRVLPQLARLKGSTTRELIGLHELTTYGTDFPGLDHPDMRKILLQRLCLNDNPDPVRLINACRLAMMLTGGRHTNIPDIIEDKRIDLDIDFQPHLHVDMRSKIRSLGLRTYKDGRREKVFESHMLPFITDDGPRFFLGLSNGLDELYQQMCERYDGMWGRATNVKQKLLAELYLQMVGTRLLHPFWDGNGRTFGAHLITAFNRMGLPVQELPKERDLWPDSGDDGFMLAYVNEKFLEKIAGSMLLTEEELLRMDEDPLLRNEYMKELHGRIKHVIEAGFLGSEFEPHILVAYHYMRLWLHEKGFLPYTENKPELNIDQSHLPPERVERMEELAKTHKLRAEDLDFSRFNI